MENINSNLVGLTDSEVQKRIDEGKVNISTNIKTKSIKRIFCDNIFTLFNLINVILLAALIFVGSHKNMLFIGVVIANIIIGIVQEIRSKISVDKLTILSVHLYFSQSALHFLFDNLPCPMQHCSLL